MGITRLRLARFGCRNKPFYRIVAIDARKRRDAAPIEYLGTYNPIAYSLDSTKEVRLQVDRIKYWLSVGAQPSDRVAYLLWRAGMAPAPPVRITPQAWMNRKKRAEAEKAAKKGFHTLAHAAASPAGALSAVTHRPAFAGLLTRSSMFAGYMLR